MAQVAADAGIGGAARDGGFRLFNEVLSAGVIFVPSQVLNFGIEFGLCRRSPWRAPPPWWSGVRGYMHMRAIVTAASVHEARTYS